MTGEIAWTTEFAEADFIEQYPPPMSVTKKDYSLRTGSVSCGFDLSRGKLATAMVIEHTAKIPVGALNEKCWPKPAIFVASTGIEPVSKV